jgi:iron complex outermembrane receptor protein
VPQKVIEDQNAVAMAEALSNVAGTFNAYPGYTGGDQDTFTIRGFSSSQTLRDGLFVYDGGMNTWLGNVVRIEVLKGPAGFLYGAYGGDVGGIINVITKKPLKEARYTLTGMADTEGSTSVIVDISQPLNSKKTWLMRIIGEKGHYATFVDNNSRNTEPLNITVQGLLTPRDSITLSYERLFQTTYPYRGARSEYALVGSGTSAYLKRLAGYNPSTNLYDPRSKIEVESNAIRAVYEHQFNPDWSIKSSTRYASQVWNALLITASPSYNVNTGISTYKQSRNNYSFPEKTLDTDLMARGKFGTWRVKHDTIFGVRLENTQYTGRWLYTSAKFSNYTFTDPSSPNWGQSEGDVTYGSYRHYKRYQLNYYFNDVISLTDKLRLVAGVTHARYGRHQDSCSDGHTIYRYDVIQDGTPWRVGVLYDVFPWLTPYFAYSTTFTPQWRNVTDDGMIQDFNPLTGDQYEWGVKIDIAKRASITASVYQLTLNNVLSSDPDPVRASLGYEVEDGTQRSRGFELDGTVMIMPGWDALVSYAYLDRVYLQSESFVYGSKIINSPEHSFRVWSVYEFQPGSFLKGFGFGGGITARSRTELNYTRKTRPNATGTIPGYAVFDGVLYYKLSINLVNILDKDYWASGSYSGLYAGEPFKATFRWEQHF